MIFYHHDDYHNEDDDDDDDNDNDDNESGETRWLISDLVCDDDDSCNEEDDAEDNDVNAADVHDDLYIIGVYLCVLHKITENIPSPAGRHKHEARRQDRPQSLLARLSTLA